MLLKRKICCTIIVVILLILVIVGCNNEPQLRSNPQEENNPAGIQKVEEIQDFSTINGYKVQEGKFFFTGVKNKEWGFYSFDIENKDINRIHQDAENYALYIALGTRRAVYIDLEGQLFYRIDNKDKKVDTQVTGLNRPNLIISPNQNAVLYTKSFQGQENLYMYFLGQESPKLIKNNIPEDAFTTFPFTTQWSKKKNYFIYNNEEIYNEKGELYKKIEATMAKWSPDDEYIVFIKKPNNLQENKIIIGDWNTYIGEELVLLDFKNKTEEIIYKSFVGLVDPIDSIQWSKDTSKVSISVGEIKRASHGELEGVDYRKIFVYDILGKEGTEVEDMTYNYYGILFNKYLYGSSLGKKDVLEIVSIDGDYRKKYETPVLLNSQDVYLISQEEEGYFLNGRKLTKITVAGEIQVIVELPWEVNEIYFDQQTQNFIITNKDMEMYLYKQ